MNQDVAENNLVIRDEKQSDIPAIRLINSAAFESEAEANLVDVLRNNTQPLISLVAEMDGYVIGHILFSPVRLTGHDALKIAGLAPMAVSPGMQGKGIGSALVRAGLKKCQEAGYGAVAVLGHTWFYPRFGFIPSARYDIRSEYDVPEEVFMMIEIEPGYLQGCSGIIKFHPAFKDV